MDKERLKEILGGGADPRLGYGNKRDKPENLLGCVSKLRKRNFRRFFRHIGVVLHLAYLQYAAFRLLDLAQNPWSLHFLPF